MANPKLPTAYGDVHTGIVELLESARRVAARSVNAPMTASYWDIGRRIVEFEQGGRRSMKIGHPDFPVERRGLCCNAADR